MWDPLGVSSTRDRGNKPAAPDPLDCPTGEARLSLPRLLLSNAFAVTILAKKSASVIAAVSATLEYVHDEDSVSSSLLKRSNSSYRDASLLSFDPLSRDPYRYDVSPSRLSANGG